MKETQKFIKYCIVIMGREYTRQIRGEQNILTIRYCQDQIGKLKIESNDISLSSLLSAELSFVFFNIISFFSFFQIR